MPTFKIFAGAKKKDGTHPIYIGVTFNRKRKNIKTHYYINESELTASGKIKNASVVDRCNIIVDDYRKTILKIGDRLDKMDVYDVVDALTGAAKKENYMFFEFAEGYIQRMIDNGSDGKARLYKNILAQFRKFTVNDIDARNITTSLLQSWVEDMKKRMMKSTVSLYFGTMRAVYYRMQFELNDEERGNIPLPNNPFKKVMIKKPDESQKRALTVEQIRQIITFPTQKNNFKSRFNIVNIARDVFVLSFLLIGMNEADLFEVGAGALKDGRLTYQRKKTRNRRADKAEISIKVEPEAEMFINFYKDDSGKRLFMFGNNYSTINAFSRAVNLGLKKIGDAIGVPGLTFYAARHSWATIAVNDCKVDKYTVHQALNHVDPITAITDVYIKKDWRNVDDANRKVIDLVAKVQH